VEASTNLGQRSYKGSRSLTRILAGRLRPPPSYRKSSIAAILYNFNTCSEDTQYTLHNENETTIRFSRIVNQVLYTIRLIFKPFRRGTRSLIYHDYKIHYIIPHGISIEPVS
jgi:hypothetical protein